MLKAAQARLVVMILVVKNIDDDDFCCVVMTKNTAGPVGVVRECLCDDPPPYPYE